MKLSEIKQILADEDIRLTKSLGQNFMHDGNQLRRIIKAAELTSTDRVLEVGPGLGPLTELLLAASGEVLAIEKDRRLYDFLKQRYAGASKLTLVNADALDYVESQPTDWTDWKLAANLPYSIASRLLVDLAQSGKGPRQIVVTLQLEAARRLVAQAGDPDYGLLTLLMQLRYESRGSFKIPSSCFFPEPEVDSACVCLVRRQTPLLDERQTGVFERVVKKSFSQRRKMMLKLLKEEWPAELAIQAFAKARLSPKTRAEEASLDQFALLAKELAVSTI